MQLVDELSRKLWWKSTVDGSKVFLLQKLGNNLHILGTSSEALFWNRSANYSGSSPAQECGNKLPNHSSRGSIIFNTTSPVLSLCTDLIVADVAAIILPLLLRLTYGYLGFCGFCQPSLHHAVVVTLVWKYYNIYARMKILLTNIFYINVKIVSKW